jgi:uncharacterized protein (TIGR02594 family)
MLPTRYTWLAAEPGPRILTSFLAMLGTAETPGAGNNPSIMAWAREAGLSKIYTADAIPWCGLAVAYAVLQAGFDVPAGPLWARNWLNFGAIVEKGKEALGDVLVFSRGNSGHVGLYVGEDADAFHVLGGNQSDAVNIKRIPRARFLGARRCKWRVNQPASVRKIKLEATGALSFNEA